MPDPIVATWNGPTGHEVESRPVTVPPAGTLRAKQLALREIRKIALQEGIDLTKIDPSDSGDAPDADADGLS